MYWQQLIQKHQESKAAQETATQATKRLTRKVLKRVFLGPKFPGVYLTHREHQCALQIMEGHTLKEIARTLELSPRTVEFYLKNIKNKLGCRTKYQMMRALLDTQWYQQILDTHLTPLGA